jgi:hypothetical protein
MIFLSHRTVTKFINFSDAHSSHLLSVDLKQNLLCGGAERSYRETMCTRPSVASAQRSCSIIAMVTMALSAS